MPQSEEKRLYKAKQTQVKLVNPNAQFLPVKQLAVLKYYCDRNNGRTFGNKKEAMKAAGYKTLTNSAQRKMFENPVFQLALDMYSEQKGYGRSVQKEQITQMFLEEHQEAKLAGDRPSAIRCVENLAKGIGYYTDAGVEDTDQQKEIDANVAQETEEIARLRVDAILKGGSMVVSREQKALPEASDNSDFDVLENL